MKDDMGKILDSAHHLSEIDRIIAYESGELDHGEAVALFQSLIDSGLVWRLQGHYGRMASHLIGAGFCYEKGQAMEFRMLDKINDLNNVEVR